MTAAPRRRLRQRLRGGVCDSGSVEASTTAAPWRRLRLLLLRLLVLLLVLLLLLALLLLLLDLLRELLHGGVAHTRNRTEPAGELESRLRGPGPRTDSPRSTARNQLPAATPIRPALAPWSVRPGG